MNQQSDAPHIPERFNRRTSAASRPPRGTTRPRRRHPAPGRADLESIFVRRLMVVGVLGVMVMLGLFLLELLQRESELLLVRDVSDFRGRVPRP